MLLNCGVGEEGDQPWDFFGRNDANLHLYLFTQHVFGDFKYRYKPGTVLGSRDLKMSKIGSLFQRTHSLVRETDMYLKS